LVDFYALGDRGRFRWWDFHPLRRVKADAAFRGWPDRPGDPTAGVRHLLPAYDPASFALLWDSEGDEVIQYTPDAQSDYPPETTLSAFVEELFAPQLAADELPGLWVATLRHLDRLAEPGAVADRAGARR
jgi:hypothetical protein